MKAWMGWACALAALASACGSTDGAGQGTADAGMALDAAAGGGPGRTDAADPVDAAVVADAVPADATPSPDPDAGPAADCASACARVAECFTQQEPAVCACAATNDAEGIRRLCEATCTPFLASLVTDQSSCASLARIASGQSAMLRTYCEGSDEVCPPPPPPHHGGATPPGMPPACVAYADRLTACIAERCPAIEPLADGLAVDLRVRCQGAAASGTGFPFDDAATLADFERLSLLLCDSDEMKVMVARRVEAERQNYSPEFLATFCAGGPLVPPGECEAGCAARAACFDNFSAQRCEFACEANALVADAQACANRLEDCADPAPCQQRPLARPDLLANYPAVECYDAELSPDVGEEGMLGATRLTPPSYPWRVTAVRYTAAAMPEGDYRCSTAPDARVEVSVTEGDAPAASPTPVAVMPVEGLDLPDGTLRFVDVPLPEPVVLRDGQHLVVAVSLGGALPEVGCIAGCQNRRAEPGRFFWSNAVQAPYDWADLESFGITAEYAIFAVGAPGE
jgi:hypothetical protein